MKAPAPENRNNPALVDELRSNKHFNDAIRNTSASEGRKLPIDKSLMLTEPK
jgi:hypothetical protein